MHSKAYVISLQINLTPLTVSQALQVNAAGSMFLLFRRVINDPLGWQPVSVEKMPP